MVKVKGKVVPVLKSHAMKTYWKRKGKALCIFNLGTRWRRVVSFTVWPLYSRIKRPPYPLNKRLCRPQRRSGRGGEDTNPIIAPAEN
jgi:hypothetical protein